MTDIERSTIYDMLDGCSKMVDPKENFNEQVKDISGKMDQMLRIMGINISIDDPEIKKMIKEAVVQVEEKPVIFEKGYTPWLDSARKDIEWKFYGRYENYLVKKKRWNWGTVQGINKSTDIILDHMKNPRSENFFGIKGLVMGDIQSGKTANYTGLINKSLDAGYKLIIVLAGLTKDLRSQTQKRLDKEVLGYETRPNFQKGNPIGVGEIQGDSFYINAITNSGDSGDLNKKVAEAITTVLNDGMQPLIAVLKKNSSVLQALINNVLSSDAGAKTNGKFDVPVLIIDDEVDQASVNTKDPNSLLEASSINRLIRTMLQKFNRYSYVGYTATPFANVFINPYGFEGDEKDIFPENFIVCLPRPNNYCGVEEYFGLTPIQNQEDDDALRKDLFVAVNDYFELFDKEIQYSKKIKVDTPVVRINTSMENAFIHFIIASAIKYSRGIEEHNSMLIHIARFKNAATSMRDIVKKKFEEMFYSYKYGEQKDRDIYFNYWLENMKPVSEDRLQAEFQDSWEIIKEYIPMVFEMTINGVIVVNGDSADVCDYESSNVGQHVIIGGDKLSRGLTLEGLIVSYYHRNSKAYDTLLQMGRWFGYRNGWIDLCRIFTTTDMVNDFINAGIATEMFKQDITDMNAMTLTPEEFGLKVKYSPRLAPTSASKMKSAKKQKISFSESLQQLLTYRKEYVENNRIVTEQFLNDLMDGEQRNNGNVVYKNVDVEKILDYLRRYKESDELVGSVSIQNWIAYIKKLKEAGELVKWTVVLHSNSNVDEKYRDFFANYKIYKNQNTDRNLYATDDMKDIFLKAVTSPSDFREFYDVDSEEYKLIDSFSANNDLITKTFTKENGLLAIYDIDVYKKEFDKEIELPNGKKRKIYKKGDMLNGGMGVIGLGAWFPKTESYENSAVEYYLNSVYLRKLQEQDAEEDFL